MSRKEKRTRSYYLVTAASLSIEPSVLLLQSFHHVVESVIQGLLTQRPLLKIKQQVGDKTEWDVDGVLSVF